MRAGGNSIGSIYHFFPGGKEQLGAEVIRRSGQMYTQLFASIAAEAPDIVRAAALATAVVTAVFAVRPATRTPRHLIAAAVGTFSGWLAWNFTLHATHATQFDTDAPVIGVSWADAGSGVLVFVAVALLLGLIVDRALGHLPGRRHRRNRTPPRGGFLNSFPASRDRPQSP